MSLDPLAWSFQVAALSTYKYDIKLARLKMCDVWTMFGAELGSAGARRFHIIAFTFLLRFSSVVSSTNHQDSITYFTFNIIENESNSKLLYCSTSLWLLISTHNTLHNYIIYSIFLPLCHEDPNSIIGITLGRIYGNRTITIIRHQSPGTASILPTRSNWLTMSRWRRIQTMLHRYPILRCWNSRKVPNPQTTTRRNFYL